jgi:hypothetical protein
VGERISPKLVLSHGVSLRWIWIWWIVRWILWRILWRILRRQISMWLLLWVLGNIWWYGHVVMLIKVHPVSIICFPVALELLLRLYCDIVDGLMTSDEARIRPEPGLLPLLLPPAPPSLLLPPHGGR